MKVALIIMAALFDCQRLCSMLGMANIIYKSYLSFFYIYIYGIWQMSISRATYRCALKSIIINRFRDQPSGAKGSGKTCCSVDCDKCFKVRVAGTFFGLVGKHQCFFKSDPGSYRNPVDQAK